ncbi:hypothetical protein PpBr36_02268 [Pyricularia pennisetigena]|uniref:hypothetical protein n=1 Tax=Pyricularia pennisetigena TaxID=1578925 RepID=UPI00114F2F24|nr:hypothetical protein PpBr36_02268 [Pyricularia pennisetigena]TLS29968.1 hypothetical protein PpBr36_02268 [Pyricularia pennisetigena]
MRRVARNSSLSHTQTSLYNQQTERWIQTTPPRIPPQQSARTTAFSFYRLDRIPLAGTFDDQPNK